MLHGVDGQILGRVCNPVMATEWRVEAISMQTLRELFEHEFKAMYYTEHKLGQALLEMAQEPTSPAIRGTFHQHWIETQAQVERLEMAFR